MNSPVSSWPFSSYNRLLEERLADRMRDAALHLTLDEERVDLRSTVVHRHVFLDLHASRVAIDFNGDDVGSRTET